MYINDYFAQRTNQLISEHSKSGDKKNAAKKRWQVYRKYLNFSFIKSLWYFGHYAIAGLRKYRKTQKGI